MTSPTKINSIQLEMGEKNSIKCLINLTNQNSIDKKQYAYYIYRNGERVATTNYQDDSFFYFNTDGIPGVYRVQGFLKVNGEYSGNSLSRAIFANPLDVTKNQLQLLNNKIAYLNIKGRKWTYPALYCPSENKRLFVLLPSAVDRANNSLPVFGRWTWALEGFFPGNVLCVADPTLALNKNLSLGWMLGNKDKCATRDFAEWIISFARQKRIPNDQIFFYGSSAGGFAALALAACVEGSTAIAINSQTEVLHYESASQVALIRQYCFNNMSTDKIESKYLERISMISRWRNVKNSRIFMVQNDTDYHHFNVHFKNFWKSLGGGDIELGFTRANQHTAWVYHENGGHIAETKQMAEKILSILAL